MMTSPTEASSGTDPLLQPAEQGQSNRESESPSSDGSDEAEERDPRYTGKSPYVGGGRASIEKLKGGTEAGPTRRDSLSSTGGSETPFDRAREEGLARLWNAEGWIPTAIEKEREARAAAVSEEASNSSR